MISSNNQALDLIVSAIKKSGFINGKDVSICLDVAANELLKKINIQFIQKIIFQLKNLLKNIKKLLKNIKLNLLKILLQKMIGLHGIN